MRLLTHCQVLLSLGCVLRDYSGVFNSLLPLRIAFVFWSDLFSRIVNICSFFSDTNTVHPCTCGRNLSSGIENLCFQTFHCGRRLFRLGTSFIWGWIIHVVCALLCNVQCRRTALASSYQELLALNKSWERRYYQETKMTNFYPVENCSSRVRRQMANKHDSTQFWWWQMLLRSRNEMW